MGWKETDVLSERTRFVTEALKGRRSMAELCRAYGVSRKTGYKWLRRYQAQGREGLTDRRRACGHHPNATPAKKSDRIIRLRLAHRTWGAKKLRDWLHYNEPEESWPARSTIEQILHRHGLVRESQKRKRRASPTNPLAHAEAPNDVWCIDFKGWFRCEDGTRCEPLTVTDAFSRFAIAAMPVTKASMEAVKPILVQSFRERGLPQRIRSDNGSPFGSTGRAGLSKLAVWLIRLGIEPERIEPAHPEQNGRHERFHRTLKEETASPPKRTLRAQNRAFKSFLKLYNEERPHDALGGLPPAAIYAPSPRCYPSKLTEMEYPPYYERRRVHKKGDIRFAGVEYHVSDALSNEDIGLLRVGEDRWQLEFGPVKLGVLDVRTRVILPPDADFTAEV